MGLRNGMDALDRSLGDGRCRIAANLCQKSTRIPVDRPALPEPELPCREDGVDLVAVAVAHELPHQVVRRREFGPVQIDEQDPLLTLDGLRLVHELNQASRRPAATREAL